MKNTIKLFGLIALVALTFAFITCGGDSEPELLPPDPTSAIFESSDAAGNIYLLVIDRAPSGSIREAYTPKANDNYVLTYYKKADKSTITSKGTVQAAGSTITLKPDTGNGTFTVTASNERMTAITVPVSSEIPAPTGTLKPKEFPKPAVLDLYGFPWNNAGSSEAGEDWVNNWEIKYKDFTDVIPKPGDKLKFQLRGTTNKPLNQFKISLCALKTDKADYEHYGLSGDGTEARPWYKLPTSFDVTLVITIKQPDATYPNIPRDGVLDKMYLEFFNVLWVTMPNGEYLFDSKIRLTETGTIMATISNLEIRFAGFVQE